MTNTERVNVVGNEERNEWAELPEVLTVREAARLLRMKPATVYESIRGGIIPAVQVSARCIRLSKAALQEWLSGKALGLKRRG